MFLSECVVLFNIITHSLISCVCFYTQFVMRKKKDEDGEKKMKMGREKLEKR